MGLGRNHSVNFDLDNCNIDKYSELRCIIVAIIHQPLRLLSNGQRHSLRQQSGN